MREFEFTVTFEPGSDALMDCFVEHDSLTAWTSVCFTTRERMWRIDHATGTEEALAAFDDVFLDESRCNECLDLPDCDTYREYHVLDESTNSRTVYTFREEVHGCHSVPHYVHEHVGDGVVFEARRSDNEYRWRVLHPDEQPVGGVYDAIEAQLRDGLSLSLSRLSSAGNWNAESRVAAELTPENRAVLEAAVEHGYYSRPREVTVSDLSDELGIPRSTLQYRLRSAEDLVVSQFVDDALS
ncbi:helix-turn-helix domain-containing protein [Halobacterium noricense]|uniref:helix-turn-helix domain-containing protein n=1 Tax=Halobacterium noricense TaxID=223182 RepID=UPI001E4D6999|nr:helix-turn-helix domain-containing protein [Halobacterium noricense]UHH25891.1 helix-turn-helix domain-containing protein [Halobacterium noricense]